MPALGQLHQAGRPTRRSRRRSSPEDGSSSRSRRGRVARAPGQLEQPGLAGGQRVGRLAGPGASARPAARTRVGVDEASEPSRGPATTDLGRGQDVLADRQGTEDLEALEGAGDAEAGPLVRLAARSCRRRRRRSRPPLMVCSPQMALKQRRLARAVGTDEAGDGARRRRRGSTPRRAWTPPNRTSASATSQKRHRHPPMRSGRLPSRRPRASSCSSLVSPGLLQSAKNRTCLPFR